MAMHVEDNKIYILVAETDAIANNRISFSDNKTNRTTGFCPVEKRDENLKFYNLLGLDEELALKLSNYKNQAKEYSEQNKKEHDEDIERANKIISRKLVYFNKDKLEKYHNKMNSIYKKKYSKFFKGEMKDFDSAYDKLIKSSNNLLCDYLFLNGTRPYLSFDNSENFGFFEKLLYGEATTIVIESFKDNFEVYLEAHSLLLDLTEINWNFEKNKENCFSEKENRNDEFEKIDDLSSLTCSKCAKFIIDTIYNFDRMDRINDLFIKTDKYVKINPKEISHAPNSCLRYAFIQAESTMYNPSSNESKTRVFTDSIYKFDVKNENVEVRLSTSWENSEVSHDGSNNNLKVLINIVNSRYTDNFKIVYDDNEKKMYTLPPIGYNKIYYGIPGCGKSYYVENTVLKDVDKKNDVFRTTFYLDYSNADFIGQIYPSVEDDKVTYIRVPGPFTEALEQAIKNKNRMIYLVIEEINRGNAAAIFGDTFQLLDRLKENKNGRYKGASEYPVSNTFIEGYFKANDIPYTPGQIYIPHNLTILATMNTSDQNVFPLDTAFKRRWDREKVVNDWNTVGDIKDYYVPYTDIKWKTFATTINNSMLETNSNSDVTISEDKQMGAYFAQKNMLTKNANEKDEEALRTFTSNVIDYLYNDVTKFDHSLLFGKEINSYDNLYNRVSEYAKALLSTPNNTDVGPHAILSKFLKEDIVKKLEENAKEDNKDKKSVEENIETDGAENEGTEN